MVKINGREVNKAQFREYINGARIAAEVRKEKEKRKKKRKTK